VSPEEEARIERVLAAAFRGIHHVPGWPRRKECGEGVSIIKLAGLATFDWDELTRLVIAAHDECVRVEILPASPRDLKILLHTRVRDAESSYERHPTMEEAVARLRGVDFAKGDMFSLLGTLKQVTDQRDAAIEELRGIKSGVSAMVSLLEVDRLEHPVDEEDSEQ
jgi:hypothetical protein